MKLVTIVGARPNFVKAAPLSAEIKKAASIEEVMLHTGQHYSPELSERLFTELEIDAPKYNLGVGSSSHGEQTGKMLSGIEEILLKEKPDKVVVFGDTNSTLAGALAAVKLHIPVAHVEAGLRSYNRTMPEEINRILTDHCSDFLLVPSEKALENLRIEGFESAKCALVGDLMYEATQRSLEKNPMSSDLPVNIEQPFILATVHRQENTDHPEILKRIVAALERASETTPIVWPVHPRTRKRMEELEVLNRSGRLFLTEPLSHSGTIFLAKSAELVITDSGGLQKEAFFVETPVVTLRGETEWTELVDLGWNRVCPPESVESITSAIEKMKGARGKGEYPYGPKNPARMILDHITG